ncbi:PhnD/SsuA/transferrin family substrate-binding protein [Actibacterium sp. 188UL27-1]|nr:PhnD/SsuA/transferrin family substrate-binding protein [Actibacterium sp. 188UL27-1]MBM7069834.1 PhnD/SsuA/transferrin family substrate-binding protein [Actibacterium sp. 188UL27-1]
MYERAETKPAHDRYWSLIRAAFGTGPAVLTRNSDLWETWRHPDLLLSQTCGLPYRAHLHGEVTLIGTPDYGVPDCPPGHYRSVIIARPGARMTQPSAAFNEPTSQSGWAALHGFLTDQQINPAHLVETGSHAASAMAVLSGQADIAAIDAVTWRILTQWDMRLADLNVIAQTPPVPGLPYIMAAGRDPDPIRQAIIHAIEKLSDGDRGHLHLTGLVMIPATDYLAIPVPPLPHESRRNAVG